MNRHPLKNWRKSVGLTQSDLGIRVGVSQQYIWHIEKGSRTPKYSTAKLLSEATGGAVSVIEIMEFRI